MLGIGPRWLAWMLALVAACAGAAPAAQTPSSESGRPLTIETPGAVRGSGDVEALERALREVGRDAQVQLKGDGRLAQLAERMAARRGESGADALLAEARALELGDAALLLRRIGVRSADLLPATLRVELPAAVRALGATHYGLYAPPAGDLALVVLSRRPVALEPVPRAIASGGTLHVRGRLAADVRGAKLLWRDPLGHERAFALSGSLVLDVRLAAAEDGRHGVELVESTDAGDRTLLAFTVDAGDVDREREPVAIEQAALLDARRRLLARLAEARAAHGLAAFSSDSALERVAEQRCRAGVDAEGATSAQARDAEGLYAALAGQPAVQARISAQEPARMGLAVCAATAELRAVAVLAGAARPSDDESERASGKVLLAINAHRRTRGGAPLRPDSALTGVAQHAAAALQAEPDADRDAVMQRANVELERFALRYRRVAAVAVVVRDVIDAATLEPALDGGASAVGIATAELGGAAAQAGSVAVIITLGWER